VQLGVSNATLLWRGARLKCPACGGGGVIVRWFGIVDRCPTCSLRIERIEGHSLGYIGLNTIAVFALTFAVLIVTSIAMVPNIRVGPLLVAALAPALVGPVLFAPGCRTIWTAIDLILRPLRPGEIDPRYVVVDPARDHPTGN
jgi:uncharacterized protein (DUF983 family)